MKLESVRSSSRNSRLMVLGVGVPPKTQAFLLGSHRVKPTMRPEKALQFSVFSLLLIQVQLQLQASKRIQQEVSRRRTVSQYSLPIQIRFSSETGLTS